MAIIKKPIRLKIGKIQLLYIDWFELTKYISVFSGVLAGLSFSLGYAFTKAELPKNRFYLGIMSILCLVLYFLGMQAVDVIRNEHTDSKIEIEVNN